MNAFVKFSALVNRVADDDAAVKLLFDHIRNLGICALVGGGALFQLKWAVQMWDSEDIHLASFRLLVALLLLVLCLFLLIVNMYHGINKIWEGPPPGLLFYVVPMVYLILAVTVVASVLDRV